MPVHRGEIELEGRQTRPGEGSIDRLSEGVHLENEVINFQGQAGDSLEFGVGNLQLTGIAAHTRAILTEDEETARVVDDELGGSHRDIKAHFSEGELHHRFAGLDDRVLFETKIAGQRGLEPTVLEAQRGRTTTAEEVRGLGRSVIEFLGNTSCRDLLLDRLAGGVELEGKIFGRKCEIVDAFDRQRLELHPARHAGIHNDHDAFNIGNRRRHRTDCHAGGEIL